MPRYLITHSLLSSWLYAIKENPYEDATSTTDKLAEFMAALNRVPIEPNEKMLNGIKFEDEVTAILEGHGDPESKWYDAECRVADMLCGAQLQVRARKVVCVAGIEFVLYGRLDALKAGAIIDTKFSTSYERGKYFDSTQHPAYLEIVPEADEFTYIICNGTEVWTETYRRDETPSIYPIIADFVEWLTTNNLWELYAEKWLAT